MTPKWYKIAYETGGSESDLLGDKGGQKVTFRGSESSRWGGQKVTHNIIVNKKENINNSKSALDDLIISLSNCFKNYKKAASQTISQTIKKSIKQLKICLVLNLSS